MIELIMFQDQTWTTSSGEVASVAEILETAGTKNLSEAIVLGRTSNGDLYLASSLPNKKETILMLMEFSRKVLREM